MSTAIDLNGAENVYFEGVTTSGFDVGIDATDSSGIIKNYRGDGLHLKEQSDFQIVDSSLNEVAVDASSRAELHNTFAARLIRVTEGSQDPLVNDLRYYARRIIGARTAQEKRSWAKRLKRRASNSEPYLKWAGYGKLVIELLKNIPL